jgi:signal transduction histidine kinase
LGPALQALSDDISRRSHLRCECEVELSAEHLTPEAAIALYRIAQEAVVNAVRHAECRYISVRLARASHPEGGVELRVEDDGKGIQPADVRGTRSLGLVGMRERAEILGGEVTITKGEKCGTVVLTRLPKAVMKWEVK